MPVVSSLFIYPIKSCAGIALDELHFDARGPVGDRRFMVVDDKGQALTLRECPRLSQVQPILLVNGRFKLTAPGVRPLRLRAAGRKRIPVTLWRFSGDALDMGDTAAQWFSAITEQACRLVAFAEDVPRFSKKPETAPAPIAFADRYPLSITTLESLSELNRRLEAPIPMHRFRPNIVLRDSPPFLEDHWRSLQHQALKFELVGPTTRCRITTLDTHTLTYGDEPLATLQRFRASETGVQFGQNAVHHGKGVLRVGDRLTSFARDVPVRP